MVGTCVHHRGLSIRQTREGTKLRVEDFQLWRALAPTTDDCSFGKTRESTSLKYGGH